MTSPRRAAGCGIAAITAVVLAIILVIAIVAWALSAFAPAIVPRNLQPVPEDVPPAVAEAPPLIDVHGPGRTSDQLAQWAQPIADATYIDPQAVRAYGNAELIARDAWPECNLAWNTLAGIGWVETRHGTYTGRTWDQGKLDDEGLAEPPIIGVPLDGSPGFAHIPDTDNGEWDGDSEYDRAMGPMQFIPESWRRYGRDANGDNDPDPQQIDDAALTAANLLCADGRDLSTPEGWRDAVFAYNQSNDYLLKVRDAAGAYAMGQPAVR
ncbi:lytic murein transglycosylase [Corynebacterium breve]|uniref:Lytic murein transglycosylase n=1 Tax=Corynebacterium breve TaxID=3049799 RepID=A0ABY8VC99_9CORY|nr:lytic murein transglycosylase [Corynebacterium breve]WIM67064.1 lytic murein transglycosylase [Corynebacterium breve]